MIHIFELWIMIIDRHWDSSAADNTVVGKYRSVIVTDCGVNANMQWNKNALKNGE